MTPGKSGPANEPWNDRERRAAVERREPTPRASAIGARLRGHRLAVGLSQTELAARLVVHPRQVSHVERGEQLPNAELLDAFIAALGLSARQADELRELLEEGAVATPESSSQAQSRTPDVWSVPGRNVHFTGRDAVLAELHQQLLGGLRTVILPIALRGLGGVGKTQVALEYAHRFKADYDVVWWIDTEQLELVDVSLARLAEAMGLASTGKTPDDARQAREALRRGEPYRRWLLIFDNAAEPDDVLAYLPEPAAHGHLLITSRDQTWASVAATLEVDVFTRSESVARLTCGVRSLAPEAASSIAELLGDLPLAVESATAWLATTGTPVDKYIEALARETMRVLSLERPLGYALPVAAVWSLSLKRLREYEPAAAHLLELASFMSPDGIATELFYSKAAIDELRRFDERVNDSIAVGTLVRAAVRYSLLRADSNELRIHRLVQGAVRAQLEGAAFDETVHAVHRILYAARPGPGQIDNPEAWPRYAQIWHHLAPSMAESCDEPEVRELMIDRVRFLWRNGEYQRALGYARPIADRWSARLQEDELVLGEQTLELNRQLLALQTEMATTLRIEGNLREAYELDTATLSRQRELLPERHPDIIVSSIMLGGDLRALGDFNGALKLDQSTYADSVTVLGADHPRTLSEANNLALSHFLVGNYARARQIDEDTFVRRRAVLGGQHPDTLHSQAQVGLELLVMGIREEAVQILTESMAGLVESIGLARPRTLSVATLLVWALNKADRTAEALALAQQTRTHYAGNYDPYHPGALLCGLALAAALSANGRVNDCRAVQIAREAVSGFEARFGADHPSTLAGVNNVAVYERRAGNPDAALAQLERVVEGLTGRLGIGHPNTCVAMANLANCLVHAGRLSDAERLERRALDHMAAALGGDHPDNAAIANNLAVTLRALGRRREARTVSSIASRTRLDLELLPVAL
ncbi:tetratricopeptide repeat protein [Actinospica sp. MGRD01-02]|uniref:Tetratricopeptide repeat protein n=1 Tax=Actinospica acidithermotolerans TaxID=2828514 RepID=A0A941IH27_9ACTN|nr:FxSxx-COOH system tetratricopeptide repeat protein [Actinospica acidithermotolerans]MBR7824758.1 tetratricopeptide repeat protein [Actinospica acidithermotolerans]